MTTAAVEALLSRRSQGIRHLGEPGPSDEELALMARAALHAPDHGELVPFRFGVVAGTRREALADLFAAHAMAAGKPAETAALERERALKAPVTVAVVARIDLQHPLVPAHEQWMCVGGAVANFMNAAHALGYAGKVLSGSKVRGQRINEAFCQVGEQLAAFIALGTGTRSPRPSGRDDRPVLRRWDGGRSGASDLSLLGRL